MAGSDCCNGGHGTAVSEALDLHAFNTQAGTTAANTTKLADAQRNFLPGIVKQEADGLSKVTCDGGVVD